MSSRVPALVTCQWLSKTLASNSGSLVVLDGSWHLPRLKRDPKQEYSHRHIPGALFFDIDGCADQKSPYDHMLPRDEQFEKYASTLGINNQTQVVVYDNNETYGLFSAPRVWWTFRVFGHDKISVLDGGLPKWLAEGFPISDVIPTVENASFKACFNKALVKSLEDLEQNIAGDESFTVVEARRPGKYNGTAPESYPGIKPGHIRGSLNLPYYNLMDKDTRLLLSLKELQDVFISTGVDLTKPFVASCGSGITACILALSAFLCGKEDVAVYDGSWLEWYLRARPENKINVPEHDLS